MITYTLVCPKDHEFSQTFDNFDDCQAQLAAEAIKCPSCGSTNLVKGLSAPNIGGQSLAPTPQCPAAAGCGNGGCALKQ
ncbi:MAG: DUF1178 family protein [Magnetovibrio sp.]|nr:DUF1178 family protein [Magnetovibrio sp.]